MFGRRALVHETSFLRRSHAFGPPMGLALRFFLLQGPRGLGGWLVDTVGRVSNTNPADLYLGGVGGTIFEHLTQRIFVVDQR